MQQSMQISLLCSTEYKEEIFQMAGIGRTWRGEWSGFVNGSSGWRDLRIIAWQPLPEPYREEQEDKGEENE